jgi:hypothetical protein
VLLRVLNGLSVEALERELAALGPNVVIVTGPFRADGAGQTFAGSRRDRTLEARQQGAIFHVYETAVGGRSRQLFGLRNDRRPGRDGRPAGSRWRAAGRRQDPEAAGPVPFVDWREFRRWEWTKRAFRRER